MAVCKFCNQEIVWVQKSGDPKPKPYNASDLTPHECEESKAAYAAKKGNNWKPAGKTPEEIRSIENQVCMKEAAQTYRLMYEHDDTQSPEQAGEKTSIIYRILRDAMREEDKKEAPK